MRRWYPLGMALLASVVTVGCESEDRPPSSGVARDSAGVRLIDLPGPGEAVDGAELFLDHAWAPTAGLETGDLLDVEVVPGRGILLLDELAQSVTLLSESGDVLASMGRSGQGPGEFNPQGLSRIVATDSSFFLPDLFLQRLTEFDFRGAVLGMWPFPLSPVYAVDWRRASGGALAFRAFEQSGDQIIRFRGAEIDTLLSVPVSNDHGNLLLAPVTVWDLTEDGHVLMARTDRPTVEARRAGSGELVWRARWTQPPTTLDEAGAAHLEGLVRERILRETPDISSEALAENLASVRYPEEAPVLAGLMAAPGGDAWVRRARPVKAMGVECLQVGSAEAYGGPVWDVLDRNGFLKARIRFPAGFSPREMVGDWIYGIMADEFGVESVARVRGPR